MTQYPGLAQRTRKLLAEACLSEKRMFGGVTFLLNGNMLCCVFERGLMLRVGKDAEAAALSKPFARPLSETRKMSGFVFIEPGGLEDDEALSGWLDLARVYVGTLPAKAEKGAGAR